MPSLFSLGLSATAYRQATGKANRMEDFTMAFSSPKHFDEFAQCLARDLCLNPDYQQSLADYQENQSPLQAISSTSESDDSKKWWRVAADKTKQAGRALGKNVQEFSYEYNVISVKDVPTVGEPSKNAFLDAISQWAKDSGWSERNSIGQTPVQRKALWDVKIIFDHIISLEPDEREQLQLSTSLTGIREWSCYFQQKLDVKPFNAPTLSESALGMLQAVPDHQETMSRIERLESGLGSAHGNLQQLRHQVSQWGIAHDHAADEVDRGDGTVQLRSDALASSSRLARRDAQTMSEDEKVKKILDLEAQVAALMQANAVSNGRNPDLVELAQVPSEASESDRNRLFSNRRNFNPNSRQNP